MRIRSNLTDETIYDTVRKRRGSSSRTHQHPSGSSGSVSKSGGDDGNGRRSRSASRRLFRLVILLVLVLILMREAANPDVYRNFFGALGAPLVAEPTAETITREELETLLGGPDAELKELPRLDGLVAELGEDGRRRLTQWLADERRAGSRAELAGEPDSELLARLASAAAGSGSVEPSEITKALNFGEQNEGRHSSAEGLAMRRALQSALDREYLSRVSDATIWTRDDADAFYRWLEIGNSQELGEWGPPIFVGFVSLLDQPAVYRGARVAMRGTAVRAESIRAADNAFGVEQYWLVWVKPEDGSDRPVMGYAVDLPDDLRMLTQSGVDQQGPEVLLDGVFLRRHLYRSQKGSELAPVLVGRIRSLQTKPEQGTDAVGITGMARTGEVQAEFLKLVAVAAVLAIGFTVVVVRYTARNGKWRREIRQRGLSNPVDFLGLAADSSAAAPNISPATNLKASSDEQ